MCSGKMNKVIEMLDNITPKSLPIFGKPYLIEQTKNYTISRKLKTRGNNMTAIQIDIADSRQTVLKYLIGS